MQEFQVTYMVGAPQVSTFWKIPSKKAAVETTGHESGSQKCIKYSLQRADFFLDPSLLTAKYDLLQRRDFRASSCGSGDGHIGWSHQDCKWQPIWKWNGHLHHQWSHRTEIFSHGGRRTGWWKEFLRLLQLRGGDSEQWSVKCDLFQDCTFNCP